MKTIKMISVICIAMALAAGPAVSEQDTAKEPRFDYNNMRQDELMQIMNVLETQAGTLKKNQAKYKRGVNPEYEEIQSKIEELEGEREAAYKKLSERWQEGDLASGKPRKDNAEGSAAR